MYFRVRYIIRDFDFGDAQISVSDPARQIDVLISKRSSDDTSAPPAEPNDGVASATCERELPARHHDEAVSSERLSIKREIVAQVGVDLKEMILHILRLARWRSNSRKGGPNPIRSAEFSWSVDGTAWKSVADNLFLKIRWDIVPSWTDETAEFVRTEVLGELDEPLGHELLREAAANREKSLRSSLVLAVVAAEVGFKQFASKALPDSEWILEKLPSPPLEIMMRAFPWSKLGVQINGKVAGIPDSIQRELKKAVTLRNQIVHTGVSVNLKEESVDSVFTAVRDLLYVLDALRGQIWAANYMSPEAIKSFSSS
jgi:hypothetical protein